MYESAQDTNHIESVEEVFCNSKISPSFVKDNIANTSKLLLLSILDAADEEDAIEISLHAKDEDGSSEKVDSDHDSISQEKSDNSTNISSTIDQSKIIMRGISVLAL